MTHRTAIAMRNKPGEADFVFEIYSEAHASRQAFSKAFKFSPRLQPKARPKEQPQMLVTTQAAAVICDAIKQVRRPDIGSVRSLLASAGLRVRRDAFTRVVSFELIASGASAPFGPSIEGELLIAASRLRLGLKRSEIAKDVVTIARENGFHSVLEYLSDLEWDGTPRLDTWLAQHMHAHNSALNSIVGRKFLIGLCRRVLWPGCVHDWAPVFHGSDHVVNNPAIAKLVTPRRFAPTLSPTNAAGRTVADAVGKWVGECQELEGLHANAAEQQRDWFAQSCDVTDYGKRRFPTHVPRQFIVFGTVSPANSQQLGVIAGDARFVPVRCAKSRRITGAGIAEDRDQLWAEAYRHALDDEPSNLSARARKAAATARARLLKH